MSGGPAREGFLGPVSAGGDQINDQDLSDALKLAKGPGGRGGGGGGGGERARGDAQENKKEKNKKRGLHSLLPSPFPPCRKEEKTYTAQSTA